MSVSFIAIQDMVGRFFYNLLRVVKKPPEKPLILGIGIQNAAAHLYLGSRVAGSLTKSGHPSINLPKPNKKRISRNAQLLQFPEIKEAGFTSFSTRFNTLRQIHCFI